MLAKIGFIPYAMLPKSALPNTRITLFDLTCGAIGGVKPHPTFDRAREAGFYTSPTSRKITVALR